MAEMIKQFKKPLSNELVMIGPDAKSDQIIFAIETSCDETAAAIVKNGRTVLANTVATQIPTHQKFGGVVPEVAAREHLEAINLVIEKTVEDSGINLNDVTAFAATVGPGLVGSLLVGLNAAKTLSLVYDKPFIGVNHLNAHVCANYIDTTLEPPFVSLLVSGGHTQLILIKSYLEQEIIGETLDDAIGEAYDKVARLLGLPYPGGPNLDKLAKEGDKYRFRFTQPKVGKYDFSFSGLKTAVLKLVNELKNNEYKDKEFPVVDIAASFQETVSEILVKKAVLAAKNHGIKQIALAGGVAANSEIRRKFFELQNQGFQVFAPPMKFCTDNATMIASSAYFLSSIMDELDVEVFSRIK